MVNTKQKFSVDTQNIKASMHNTIENHQVTKEESKIRNKGISTQPEKKKENFNGNKYIPINTQM